MADSRNHLDDAYATALGLAAMGSFSLLALLVVSLPVLIIGRAFWRLWN